MKCRSPCGGTSPFARSEDTFCYRCDKTGRRPTINIHELSQNLGISSKILYRLITGDPWLVVGRTNKRGRYHVTDAALQRFIRGRRIRLLVRPAAIPNLGMRRIAVFAHLADPGAWWSTAQLAYFHHGSKTSVLRWRSAGWLAGQWLHYGQGYFWYGRALPAPFVDPRRPKAASTLLRLGIAH